MTLDRPAYKTNYTQIHFGIILFFPLPCSLSLLSAVSGEKWHPAASLPRSVALSPRSSFVALASECHRDWQGWSTEDWWLFRSHFSNALLLLGANGSFSFFVFGEFLARVGSVTRKKETYRLYFFSPDLVLGLHYLPVMSFISNRMEPA